MLTRASAREITADPAWRYREFQRSCDRSLLCLWSPAIWRQCRGRVASRCSCVCSSTPSASSSAGSSATALSFGRARSASWTTTFSLVRRSTETTVSMKKHSKIRTSEVLRGQTWRTSLGSSSIQWLALLLSSPPWKQSAVMCWCSCRGRCGKVYQLICVVQFLVSRNQQREPEDQPLSTGPGLVLRSR